MIPLLVNTVVCNKKKAVTAPARSIIIQPPWYYGLLVLQPSIAGPLVTCLLRFHSTSVVKFTRSHVVARYMHVRYYIRYENTVSGIKFPCNLPRACACIVSCCQWVKKQSCHLESISHSVPRFCLQIIAEELGTLSCVGYCSSLTCSGRVLFQLFKQV